MDTNNWRPNPPGEEPALDTDDSRAQLPPDSGQRLIGKRKSLDSTAQKGHAIGADWQEEIHHKIKAMTETYLPELNEMLQKIAAKFQQNESLPQPPKPEQLEKLKVFKAMLERIITFLQVPKHDIKSYFKEKLYSYEKQIINFINSNKPRKPDPSQQLGGPGQLIGLQSNVVDLQQQQKKLLGKQNSLQNLQQQKQLMAQQNNLSGIHQQQLGPQSNISGLSQQQQPQLLGTHSGNPSMQINQHSVHMLHPSEGPMQQQQQNSFNLLPSQGQQSQTQPSHQQLMSQMQSLPGKLQQQLGLKQQPNLLQRDMEQRLQASSSLFQPQIVIDPQKQLYQSQRALPETLSISLDSKDQTGRAIGADWQEEVYQKIKSMKETYLSELSEMHQKIVAKCQQNESLPQPPKPEQLEKLKVFRAMLERIITFLQVPKHDIKPHLKEKLGSYEKQIINFISSNKPRKPDPSQHLGGPGQLLLTRTHSMQQSQSQLS